MSFLRVAPVAADMVAAGMAKVMDVHLWQTPAYRADSIPTRESSSGVARRSRPYEDKSLLSQLGELLQVPRVSRAPGHRGSSCELCT
jgi:hypothetical protein